MVDLWRIHGGPPPPPTLPSCIFFPSPFLPAALICWTLNENPGSAAVGPCQVLACINASILKMYIVTCYYIRLCNIACLTLVLDLDLDKYSVEPLAWSFGG